MRRVRPNARPRPSFVLATIAAAIVASPFAIIVTGSEPRPTDNHREVPPTAIDQIGLGNVPSAVVDLAESGLSAAGLKLPEIDPTAFGLRDLSGVQGPAAPETPADPESEPVEPAPQQNPEPSAESESEPEPEASPAPQAPTSPGAKSAAPEAPPAPPRMADGREVGVAVKHIVRDDPLKMVAFTWDRAVDASMMLRARNDDGSWGDWLDLDPVDTAYPVSAEHPMGTEPVWVGDAKEVQVAVSDDGLAIPAAEPQGGGLVELGIGTASTVVTELLETVVPALTATLISPEGLLSLGSSLLTPLLGGPQVVARAQWGADESMRCSQPTFSPNVRGAVVHHTAGSNDYTPEQSAEIVRGIYAYHARTLNWCDIGYNVLVDKYGQIFEGAFGGLDRNVEGTHTGGFNKNTVGVSMIGNLDEVAPTTPMISSVANFLRWRLGKAGVNPATNAQLTAEYFSDSKFPVGAVTNLPVISGHRDYNNTSCPGEFGYAALGPIRTMVAGSSAPPEPAPQESAPQESAPPAEPAPAPPPAEPVSPAPPPAA
ncbi:peptidoglycan recognition protein [Gordonia sp. Z-3]|uniref:peptidoglycan recognition protein family protein n=1 Tax=Gordonia sp. Z-3 TaxID=3115408 RepID=UPI002E28314A|nr:peptidoglycan recognition protein [Gordonia sp. Z-3]MED5803869.1 peptidoglycan recognition protein [Gordonia sp. Z-3]